MALASDVITLFIYKSVELEVLLWDTCWLETFILSDTQLESILV